MKMIDADALIASLECYYKYAKVSAWEKKFYDHVIEIIKSESENPRAHWTNKELKDKEDRILSICSNCGAEHIHGRGDHLYYCYNCGCRMEGILTNDELNFLRSFNVHHIIKDDTGITYCYGYNNKLMASFNSGFDGVYEGRTIFIEEYDEDEG